MTATNEVQITMQAMFSGEKPCVCGCGEPRRPHTRGSAPRFASDECRRRYNRRKRLEREAKALLLGEVFPPGARATDPPTSHAAITDLTTSGARSSARDEAVALVRRHPGRTYQELAATPEGRLVGMQPMRLMTRLNDAADGSDGRIRRGEPKTCSVTGRRAQTWWPR